MVMFKPIMMSKFWSTQHPTQMFINSDDGIEGMAMKGKNVKQWLICNPKLTALYTIGVPEIFLSITISIFPSKDKW